MSTVMVPLHPPIFQHGSTPGTTYTRSAIRTRDGLFNGADSSAWISNYNLMEKGPSAAYAGTDWSQYQVFYVSNNGDDTNPGTEAQPFLTLAKAFAAAKNVDLSTNARAVLLERGGTYTANNEKWGWMNKSDDDEFAILGEYGTGMLPIIRPSTPGGDIVKAIGNGDHEMDGALFARLVFRPYSDSSLDDGLFDGFGFNIIHNADNLWLEDMDIQYFREGIKFDNADLGLHGEWANNFQILRSIVSNNGYPAFINGNKTQDNTDVDGDGEDEHSIWHYRSQGIYVAKVRGIVIEHSTIWRNGWTSWHPAVEALILDLSNPPATPFDERYNASEYSHGVYIQYSSDDRPDLGLPVIVRCNFFGNNASHGAQVRSGGIVESNVFWKDAIGLLVGSPEATSSHGDTHARGMIVDNLVLETQNISQQSVDTNNDGNYEFNMRRGWGVVLNSVDQTSIVSENIIAHMLGNQSYATYHEAAEHSGRNASISWDSNRIYEAQWQFRLVNPIPDGTVTYEDNEFSTVVEGSGVRLLAGPLAGFWASNAVKQAAGSPPNQSNLANFTITNNTNVTGG